MESTMESTMKSIDYRMKSIEIMYKMQLNSTMTQMLDKKGHLVLEKLPELVRNFIQSVEGVMCNSCFEKGYSEYIIKLRHSVDSMFDPLNKFETDIVLWINENKSIVISRDIPLWSFSFHNNFFDDIDAVLTILDKGGCPCPDHIDYCL